MPVGDEKPSTKTMTHQAGASGQAASAVEAGTRGRHPSPRFTKSCIANCESPTIADHRLARALQQ
jgi:hypothetical protein